MKIVSSIALFTVLFVGLILVNHKAQAGLYDVTRFATSANHKISRRPKVRIRYRRRFGRRYSRRISAFVRFGPYVARRSLRKRSRRRR